MKSSKKAAVKVSDPYEAYNPRGLHWVGPYMFLIGFAVALISAVLAPNSSNIYGLVALIGIAVGMFNIEDREVHGFLLATITISMSVISLKIVDVFAAVPILAVAVPAFLNYLVAFIAPAATIVAFKQIWMLAKD